MRQIIVTLMAFCLVLGTSAQNKKLIIGEWVIEKMYMNDQLLYDRNDEVSLFATYKKIAFGDTTEMSATDSLALAETIDEAKKNLGSITIGFDGKGNHTAGSYDSKTKKQSYSKGTYKFAAGNDKSLLIKMIKSKTFDRINIVEVTATTLTIDEGGDGNEDEPMLMVFTRKPAKQQKPKQ